MNKTVLIIASILIWLFSPSCQADSSPVPTTKSSVQMEVNSPSIRGQITYVSVVDDEVIGISIEGEMEQDTVYDKARVGINKETRIYIKSQDLYIMVDTSALEEGLLVEALFIDPINLSDPVSAFATEIVILK